MCPLRRCLPRRPGLTAPRTLCGTACGWYTCSARETGAAVTSAARARVARLDQWPARPETQGTCWEREPGTAYSRGGYHAGGGSCVSNRQRARPPGRPPPPALGKPAPRVAFAGDASARHRPERKQLAGNRPPARPAGGHCPNPETRIHRARPGALGQARVPRAGVPACASVCPTLVGERA